LAAAHTNPNPSPNPNQVEWAAELAAKASAEEEEATRRDPQMQTRDTAPVRWDLPITSP